MSQKGFPDQSKTVCPERSRVSGEVEGLRIHYRSPMSFWVYILRCSDGSYYTDHTDNLEQRVNQHNAGTFEGYTATRHPVQLLFSQECSTRIEALEAERQLKGWSRKKKEALMRGDWTSIKLFARGKHKHQR
jgi:putative endonuclease